jgi:glycosyltransferase involved in cell wall biosynthesis
VRILLDYRPALRERSGVGEYVHQLSRALARKEPGSVTLFSSSWKDRPSPESVADLGRLHLLDFRLPVRALNAGWHYLGWPPVELLARARFDVVHSPHPLLLPSRHAAQVITIHDLDFLTHPERTHAEVRRDYPRLVTDHARRADHILVPSAHTAGQVQRLLGIPAERLSICPDGAPDWVHPSEGPVGGDRRGYILFVGTLEPRKNIPGLLAAYGLLAGRRPNTPPLVLAGKATAGIPAWQSKCADPPLAGRVKLLGYVHPQDRLSLYRGAAVLVLPSFEEGFGLPALEAMALGIPVVASDRGALPEVVGDAGALVDPEDVDGLAAAIERVLDDDQFAAAASARGLIQSRQFSWDRCASLTHEAYVLAMAARHRRQA